MNRFTSFYVDDFGNLFGVWSINTEDLNGFPVEPTLHVVPERKWDDEFGAYDPCFINCDEVDGCDADCLRLNEAREISKKIKLDRHNQLSDKIGEGFKRNLESHNCKVVY